MEGVERPSGAGPGRFLGRLVVVTALLAAAGWWPFRAAWGAAGEVGLALGAALGLGLSGATFLARRRALRGPPAALQRVLVGGFLGRMVAALAVVALAAHFWEGDPTGLVAGVIYFYVALVIYEAAAFEGMSRRRTGG